MKNTIAILILGGAVMLGACVDDDDVSNEELTLEEGPSQCPDGPPWLTSFDTNGDKVLQLDELPERMRDRIAGADTDADGALSRAELQELMRSRAEARFARADASGDGALTEDEVGDAHRWARVVLADADADGAVTLDELRVAFEAGTISPSCDGDRPGSGGRGHRRPF